MYFQTRLAFSVASRAKGFDISNRRSSNFDLNNTRMALKNRMWNDTNNNIITEVAPPPIVFPSKPSHSPDLETIREDMAEGYDDDS